MSSTASKILPSLVFVLLVAWGCSGGGASDEAEEACSDFADRVIECLGVDEDDIDENDLDELVDECADDLDEAISEASSEGDDCESAVIEVINCVSTLDCDDIEELIDSDADLDEIPGCEEEVEAAEDACD